MRQGFTGSDHILLVGLVTAAVLCGISLVMAVALSCNHCGGGPFALPLAGTVCYSSFAVLWFMKRAILLLSCGLTVALATHAVLLLSMYQTYSICPICVATALVSATCLTLLIARAPRALVPFLVLAPAAYGVAYSKLSAIAWIESQERPQEGHVNLIVYERPGCPSCQHFKETIVPDVLQRYDSLVRIRFITERGMPPTVSQFPAVIIATASQVRLAREPLDLKVLHQEIARALAKSP